MKKLKITYGDFEIRRPTFIGGTIPEEYANDWDIVLWQNHAPYEVTDGRTGEKRISTRSCFSIGSLCWNKKEECYQFESCGLRWLKYGTDDAAKWILEFVELLEGRREE